MAKTCKAQKSLKYLIAYLEGLLTTCSFDYLNDNPWDKSFVAFIFTCAYLFPLSILIMCYSKIVSTVFAHEKTLRDQAKKMNVESLRSSNNVRKLDIQCNCSNGHIILCILQCCHFRTTKMPRLKWKSQWQHCFLYFFGNKNYKFATVCIFECYAMQRIICLAIFKHPNQGHHLDTLCCNRLDWCFWRQKPSNPCCKNIIL